MSAYLRTEKSKFGGGGGIGGGSCGMVRPSMSKSLNLISMWSNVSMSDLASLLTISFPKILQYSKFHDFLVIWDVVELIVLPRSALIPSVHKSKVFSSGAIKSTERRGSFS